MYILDITERACARTLWASIRALWACGLSELTTLPLGTYSNYALKHAKAGPGDPLWGSLRVSGEIPGVLGSTVGFCVASFANR